MVSGVKEYNSLGDFMYKNPDVTVDHLEYLRIFKYVNVKKKRLIHDAIYFRRIIFILYCKVIPSIIKKVLWLYVPR